MKYWIRSDACIQNFKFKGSNVRIVCLEAKFLKYYKFTGSVLKIICMEVSVVKFNKCNGQIVTYQLICNGENLK